MKCTLNPFSEAPLQVSFVCKCVRATSLCKNFRPLISFASCNGPYYCFTALPLQGLLSNLGCESGFIQEPLQNNVLSRGTSHEMKTIKQASEQDCKTVAHSLLISWLFSRPEGVDQAVLPKQLKISSVNFYCCHILHWHSSLYCSIHLVRAGNTWKGHFLRQKRNYRMSHSGVGWRHLTVFSVIPEGFPLCWSPLGWDCSPFFLLLCSSFWGSEDFECRWDSLSLQ